VLFETPELQQVEIHTLGEIEELKKGLTTRLRAPSRWFGSLRRAEFARAVQGSNSIEGFEAAIEDVAAIDLGQEPLDLNEETRLAIKGYRDAMTYVLQLADDADFAYSEQLLKSLHFIMTSYDLKSRPGLWRAGLIFVRNDAEGEIVYEGPDVANVPRLISELVNDLNADIQSPQIVRAAMAHLNLVLVHPFRDGNGRMARCLQTLVLAREGVLVPSFCSIEEYLGRNTQQYYDILADVGGGSWRPERDARPWIRFTMTAHLRQIRTLVRRVKEGERLWGDLEQVAAKRGLPERSISALWDAAMGFKVRNATYRAGSDEDLTEQSAGRDLRQMADLKLLIAHGEKRGRYYVAGSLLRKMRQVVIESRDQRDDSDPFAKRP
jgi:Fic family protein